MLRKVKSLLLCCVDNMHGFSYPFPMSLECLLPASLAEDGSTWPTKCSNMPGELADLAQWKGGAAAGVANHEQGARTPKLMHT